MNQSDIIDYAAQRKPRYPDILIQLRVVGQPWFTVWTLMYEDKALLEKALNYAASKVLDGSDADEFRMILSNYTGEKK